MSNEELLELDVDVLAPAALENVITKDNAVLDIINLLGHKHIRAQNVENQPVDQEFEQVLAGGQIALNE